MLKFKKKGFTLIELMIVLAIIAILAVVLIPKAGALKGGARDAGVTENVNQVRGFLEKKIDNDKANASYSKSLDTAKGTLEDSLDKAFAGDNAIANPISKDTSIASAYTTGTSGVAPAIYISASPVASYANYKGSVIIEISGSTSTLKYTIYGVDSNGSKITPSADVD